MRDYAAKQRPSRARPSEVDMKFQRKVYANNNEKVVDAIIGVVLWHLINIVLGVIFSIAFSAMASVPFGDANLSNTMNIISLVTGCIPFIFNVGLMIYFGLTRYWIALGMLGTFAAYLILTICLLVFFGAACFAILGGLGSSGL